MMVQACLPSIKVAEAKWFKTSLGCTVRPCPKGVGTTEQREPSRGLKKAKGPHRAAPVSHLVGCTWWGRGLEERGHFP